MKNFKKIAAAFSAAAIAATAMFSAMTVSAVEPAEIELDYTQSEAAFTQSDDGASARVNLYNTYGETPIEDLSKEGVYSGSINVTFTVEGIGSDAYTANLLGMVGADLKEELAGDGAVAIEGDGTYTTEFALSGVATSLECLYLETDINTFDYETLNITIDSVSTYEASFTVAYMAGQIGAEECWSVADAETAGSTVANISGDAQYMVEWVCGEGGGTEGLEFLIVQMEGLTAHQYENLAVTVDAVYIDGAPVAGYKTSDAAVNTTYYEGATGATRIYLIDKWAGTGVADLPADSTIAQSVKVVFTISGLGVEGISNMPAVDEYVLGDANLDGAVDLYDAIAIAKYMMGMEVEIDTTYADITEDGKVDLYDAIQVARVMMGLA